MTDPLVRGPIEPCDLGIVLVRNLDEPDRTDETEKKGRVSPLFLPAPQRVTPPPSFTTPVTTSSSSCLLRLQSWSDYSHEPPVNERAVRDLWACVLRDVEDEQV